MGLACVERFRESRLLLVDIDDRALQRAGTLAPEAALAVADLGFHRVDRRAQCVRRRRSGASTDCCTSPECPDDGRR